MTQFTPTSVVTSSGGVAPIGAPTLLACVNAEQAPQPVYSYAQVPSGGDFEVALTGPFTTHGPGDGVAWIRYRSIFGGTSTLEVKEGSTVIYTGSLPYSLDFTNVAFQVSTFTQSSSVSVRITTSAVACEVAWIAVLVPNPNCDYVNWSVPPIDELDGRQFAVCSRTGYKVPLHDQFVSPDGRIYSLAKANPPATSIGDRREQ